LSRDSWQYPGWWTHVLPRQGVYDQQSIGRNRFGLRFGGDERNVLKNTRESSATAVYTLIFVT